MSFFVNPLGGNPFSTPVGGKIEQATDASLASENWSLNMEICDIINDTEEGPKDAIKAIRKRLTQNAGKNYQVVMYTLIVLETCVKNCSRHFHILVCNKDFIQELVKLIGPKNDPPTAVQEKVLSLIQAWADAFRNIPDLSGVVSVYNDLIMKGIEFPATDLDAMAPIITPQRSVEPSTPSEAGSPFHTMINNPIVTGLGPDGILTPVQRTKLQSELDVMQSNIVVLGEMLSEMKPGEEKYDELEFVQELNATTRSMQERLVDLIGRLSNDEITAELLRINDDANNVFLRYGRWEKNRGAGGQSASAVLARAIAPNQTSPNSDDSLIDLGPPDDLTDKLSKLEVSNASASAQLASIGSVNARNGPQGDDEFDMFAQSRKVNYEKTKNEGSTYKDNLEPDQLPGGLSSVARNRNEKPEEREFDEIEAWLGSTQPGVEETVTSSDFERFLAERAAAAEALPSTTTSPQRNPQKRPSKEEKGLYAL